MHAFTFIYKLELPPLHFFAFNEFLSATRKVSRANCICLHGTDKYLGEGKSVPFLAWGRFHHQKQSDGSRQLWMLILNTLGFSLVVRNFHNISGSASIFVYPSDLLASDAQQLNKLILSSTSFQQKKI
jgi:hypothetical protein